MLEQKKYKLLLTEIECIHSTTEGTRDDVFFDIYVDNVHYGYFHKNNPLKMDEYDHDDVKRYLNIEVGVEADSVVHVFLWDKDGGFNGADDQLGDFTISRNDPLEGSKTFKQTTGQREAEYKVSWRVIYKPIPTLRIHGIKCEKSSSDCNESVVKAILGISSDAAKEGSNAIGIVKSPRSTIVSAGFSAVSHFIGLSGLLSGWIAGQNDDDIYLQHIDRDGADADGGAFCPPANSGISCIKMNDGDEVSFFETYGQYFRFPLDRGDLTIQVKESDPLSDDDSLGTLTISELEFNQLIEEGAQVKVASEYLDGKGQGAVYHLCYSVAWENWALPPTQVDQETVPPPTPPEPIALGDIISGHFDAGTHSTHRWGNYGRYFTFSLAQSTDVTISLQSKLDAYLFLMRGSETTGEVIAENDDANDSTNSEIRQTLPAGDYMIEATTHFPQPEGGWFEVALLTSTAMRPIKRGDTISDAWVWDDNIFSIYRSFCCAKYFTFSLTTTANVAISLSSSIDTYLYLLGGSELPGVLVAENNDFGSSNSEINQSLAPGDYIIEATTTTGGEVGSFVLFFY